MTTATEQALDERLHRLFSNTPTELEVQGDSFTDIFEVVDVLGKGAEGEVYRVEDAEGRRYSAKVISVFEDSPEERTIQRQIQALQALDHENIPSYVDCLVEEKPKLKKREYILLTEDVQGETLADRWKRKGAVKKQELEDICSQTLDALAHAHEEGVLHRDIKPENILLTPEGKVKLIDWGVAKIEGQKTRWTTMGVVGTAGYMAPEVLKGEKATNKSDIYSLGTTLIAAARGEDNEPFDSAKEIHQYLSGLEHLRDFRKKLEAMIQEDPDARRWKLVDGKYEFESVEVREIEVAKETAVDWRVLSVPTFFIGALVGGVGYVDLAEAPSSIEGFCSLASLTLLAGFIVGMTFGSVGYAIGSGIEKAKSIWKGREKTSNYNKMEEAYRVSHELCKTAAYDPDLDKRKEAMTKLKGRPVRVEDIEEYLITSVTRDRKIFRTILHVGDYDEFFHTPEIIAQNDPDGRYKDLIFREATTNFWADRKKPLQALTAYDLTLDELEEGIIKEVKEWNDEHRHRLNVMAAIEVADKNDTGGHYMPLMRTIAKKSEDQLVRKAAHNYLKNRDAL